MFIIQPQFFHLKIFNKHSYLLNWKTVFLHSIELFSSFLSFSLSLLTPFSTKLFIQQSCEKKKIKRKKIYQKEFYFMICYIFDGFNGFFYFFKTKKKTRTKSEWARVDVEMAALKKTRKTEWRREEEYIAIALWWKNGFNTQLNERKW